MKKRSFKRLAILLSVVLLAVGLAGCGGDAKAEDDPNEEQTEAAGTQAAEASGGAGDIIVMGGGSEEPVEELSLKDRIRSMQITYRFDDDTVTLDGSTISGWLLTMGDGSLSVNEVPAKEFVAGIASKYDTFGRNRRFTTHEGSKITVSGGDYGYWMDRVSTRQELIQQILTGESAELTPVYYGKAASYSENDIGNTYVEIDLADQHLWVYRDGSVVNESDFVSGGLFKGNNTPDGTYAITYKERDATLVGQGYQSAVKYWMPFNGNIGMHDAPWRDSFGGHIYYMNGSHGCINLPSAKAAEIFDQVDKGEAVVVYGGITKDEAMASLSMEDKATAAQKGYISMTTDIAAYIFQQQGFDAETAAALAAAQQTSDDLAAQAQAALEQAAAEQAAAEGTVEGQE